MKMNFKGFWSKNSSKILVWSGLAMMTGSTIAIAVSTPKALRLIEEKKQELEVEELEPKDVVKVVAPVYLAPVMTFIAGGVSVVTGNNKAVKQAANATAALAVTEKAFKETVKAYRSKIAHRLGEEAEKEITSEVKAETTNVKKKIDDSGQVIVISGGDVMCKDRLTGRYFKSSAVKIQKALNELNAEMNNNDYISINDYSAALGMEPLEMGGEDTGFNREFGLLTARFGSELYDGETPILVVDVQNSSGPRYDYRTLH